MRAMLRTGAVCILAVVALMSCTANDNSIFKSWDVSGRKVALIGQAIRDSVQSTINGVTRFCAGPNPDAFSILSSGIDLCASASDEDELNAALQFSRSIKESSARASDCALRRLRRCWT